MTFQEYLQTKNMTGYRLSKCSGVPKTTVTDICTGKSSLEKCTAGTVKKIAEALDCSMEFLVNYPPPTLTLRGGGFLFHPSQHIVMHKVHAHASYTMSTSVRLGRFPAYLFLFQRSPRILSPSSLIFSAALISL